jgi:molybdopterin-guanine dinucleotide biosynthesis protein A
MTALAGLVLCGGVGRRMGRDKAMVRFEGTPLVIHAARLLERVAAPVFLASGTPGRLGGLGYPEVVDEVAGAGPLAGIAGGLAASPHDLLAVVAVDLPFASPAVFDLLATLRHAEDAVVPIGPHGPEPLHAIYATSALPLVRRELEAGRLAVRGALRGLRVRYVSGDEWRPADPEARFARNVNTVEELRSLPPA